MGLFVLAGSSPAAGTIINFFISTLSNISNYQDIQAIKKFVKHDIAFVEKHLQDFIAGSSSELSKDVAANILNSGGKRIRPIITILSGKLFGFQEAALYQLATAVELIHTATLLHDDVIDNSEMRRGNKTANNLYGNKAPILVGDYLFSGSFMHMVNTGSLDALQILAKASSVIAEGEVRQLELQNKKSFIYQDYLNVITAKTAILFAAAAESAAVLANRSSSQARIMHEFGLNLGIAFQIIDDVLDYSADAKKIGKNLGDDFYEQKITLPIILLYEQSDSNGKTDIARIFNKDDPQKNDLNFILSELNSKNIFARCLDQARSHIDQALHSLSAFPENEYRQVLEAICYVTISRES